MKHILLPTDFSGTSVKAAYFAMDLYGAEDARYTLLNTYLKPAYGNVLLPPMPDTERASRNGLRRGGRRLALIHISEPTRPYQISYALFCLKKKQKNNTKNKKELNTR